MTNEQAKADLVITTELLNNAEREKLRKDILKQREDGVIILPWYCKVFLPEPYKGEQPKIIKCPNCGNVQFADKEWCPDCGAKMVKQEEGDK